jgi:metal-responsive CopG/Arc/MetJ family transcriptional regulator
MNERTRMLFQGVRLPADLLEKIDAVVRKFPFPTDRSKIIRLALERGLPRIRMR